MAASPLPSQGPKRGRKCYVTPAFSGIPNAKRGEGNQKRSPTKGNKIRSGRLTLPSRGPKRGQKCYVTLESSGFPNANHGEQNQKWSQQEGIKSEMATSRLFP